MKVKGHQILLKSIVGSHSYGTNVEGSDIDYKGVYIQTPNSVLRSGYIPQIEVTKDEVYYEVGRFLTLCETANPTVLELLYSPEDCIAYINPVFKRILESRSMFLTKKCRHSFGGYAVQQIRKARGLEKKMNWERERIERRDILDHCYVHRGCGSIPVKEFLKDNNIDQAKVALVNVPHMKNCYSLYFTHSPIEDFMPQGIARDLLTSNDVNLSSIPKSLEESFIPFLMFFNKESYSMHCKEYKEYQDWLKNRNVQRYVDIESHGQQIDGKNMLHCVRLLETAIEIPKTKCINVRRSNADYLINIRKGKVDLESILNMCELKITNLDEVFDISDLPDHVDQEDVKKLMISVRESFQKEQQKETPY